jgi:hypothetical protein
MRLNYLHENCSWVFPLSGCANKFQVGQRLALKLSILPFPVRLIGITDTSFTFVGLPGNPEGAGRAITFSFRYGADCADYLSVRTSSNGGLLTKSPWDLIDFAIAHVVWQMLANDLAWSYETKDYSTHLHRSQLII